MTDINLLLKQSAGLKPLIQLGKHGISENVIEEIKKALKKRKLIKIKCLRYFLESFDSGNTNKEKLEGVAALLEKVVSCKVIEKKGFTLTLWQQ